MKVMKKHPKVLIALFFFTDVTAILLDLLSSGGTNGKIFINNQTMGGDPAPERVKTLRIFARNSRNEEREFDYDEKSYMDVYPFALRREDRSDFDRNRPREDHYRNDDLRDREDYNGFSIIRGFYGVNGNTVNVTDRLRAMTQGKSGISTKVNNTSMGVDPAPGADKILIVIYSYQHKEQALVLHEGDSLTLP
jgi:hypothetical protein